MATKTDHQIIRDYVTAADHLQYSLLPEDVVAILMTHSNLPTKHLDIRLNLHSTIAEVKDKFRTHIGTSPEHQRLILKDNGRTIGELADNSKMLGFYSVKSGQEIHIIDTDPFSLSRNGGLTDVSLVDKYKISEESYSKRSGTVREFLKKKREEDPNFSLKPKKNDESENAEAPGPETVSGIEIGNRCQVMPGKRRGTVMFVGEVPKLRGGGYWVGIKFDEPVGLTNGSAGGVSYFTCPENYGSFVRGKNVTVGDFPVRDLMDSDEEEDTECHCEHNDDDEI